MVHRPRVPGEIATVLGLGLGRGFADSFRAPPRATLRERKGVLVVATLRGLGEVDVHVLRVHELLAVLTERRIFGVEQGPQLVGGRLLHVVDAIGNGTEARFLDVLGKALALVALGRLLGTGVAFDGLLVVVRAHLVAKPVEVGLRATLIPRTNEALFTALGFEVLGVEEEHQACEGGQTNQRFPPPCLTLFRHVHHPHERPCHQEEHHASASGTEHDRREQLVLAHLL